MKEKTKERLVKVYLEICRNKTILLNSGLLQTSVITRDDDTFIDTVKKLSNKEITPLYKFNKKRLFLPKGKKAIERRKKQYALNYVVRQINDLKIIAEGSRTKNAPAVRLSIRLKTLEKHLTVLENTLSPVGKKK